MAEPTLERSREVSDLSSDFYRLFVMLTVVAIVGDATTTWWMQRGGAGEMNPILTAVKADLGLLGMVAVLVVAKLLLLAIIATFWRAAAALESASAEWATVAVSTLVCAGAFIPVVYNVALAR